MKRLLITLLSIAAINVFAMKSEYPRRGHERIEDGFHIMREDGSTEAICEIEDGAGPFSVKASTFLTGGLFFDGKPFFGRKEVDTKYFFVERDELEGPIYCLISTDDHPTREFTFDEFETMREYRGGNWKIVKNPKDPLVYKCAISNAIILGLTRKMRQEARKARTRLLFDS